ncbi:ATP-binding protein [Micromonospora sp. KC723]|uniref:sensor histidine kinase n=1 Tax=Micromonospora sp. KC723 TaxID=2530381 RepID=UPI0010439629|nr:ATP-binding protein [Micromonospora sp. KC723]TDB77932.1 hypothetical protein E1165_02135 [Micromonospora sp. KC723]
MTSAHLADLRLVRIARGLWNAAANLLRKHLPAHLERIGLRDPAGDELHQRFAVRSADWVVVACFVHRIVATPLVLIGGLSTIGPTADRYGPVVVGLMVWNVFLTVGVLRQRIRPFLAGRAFAVVDLALAAGVNLWGAAVLPQGELLHPYKDVYWIYAMGTVAGWTALKGVRAGLWLAAAGGILLLGMVGLNGASLSGAGWGHLLSRFGWLLSAVPLPLIVLRLGRQGAGLGNTEGRRAGRALERIRALRTMHDTVLQTLAQIAQRAVAVDLPAGERARHIHRLAAEQLAGLDRAIRADDRDRTGLVDGLQGLVRRFGEGNLRVDLLADELAADPPPAVTAGLLAAVQEALTNVRKHARTDRAIVRAATTGRGYEVVIRDYGRGFDPEAHRSGVGISESVYRRMAEIGGRASIWSEPDRGTRVRLAVDFGAASRARRFGIAPHAAITLGPTTSTSVDALTNQALAWFIVAALAYRVALSPLQVGTLFANLDPRRAWLFFAAIVGVFAFDLALLIVLLMGRFGRLFRSRALLVVDVGLTAGLNIWSAFLLPAGTLLAPGHEVLWGYMLGAVAFWTGLRGVRTGLAVVVGGIPLQLAMAAANQTALSPGLWPQLVARQGWLAATVVIAWLLTRLARRGAQRAVDEGIKTGLAIERTWALRDLYAEVARSLTAITARTCQPVTHEDLMDIRGTALDQVNRLREVIDQERGGGPRFRLAAELSRLAGTFRSHGLRVELVTSQLTSDPPPEVREAIVAAVAEALRGVAGHAAVAHAVVRASNADDGFEISVRDHGLGSPAQMQASGALINDRLATVGGLAEIRCERGNGTRIRLRWRPSGMP